MKKIFYVLLFLWPVICLSGCIQKHTILYVKPDGSGVIEETVLISDMVADTMDSFAAGVKTLGEEAEEKPDNNTLKDKKNEDSEKEAKKNRKKLVADMSKEAEKNAAQFGDYVKLVSVETIKTDSASGYKSIYSFNDIGKIRINQNPRDKVEENNVVKGNSSGRDKFITFTFTKGSPARLIITFPALQNDTEMKQGTAKKEDSAGMKPDKESDRESIEMMKKLFKDMKLSIAIKVDGVIVKTNATYREGSKITLMDIDFAKIIDNIELLKKISTINPNSIEEMKSWLRDIPGVRNEFCNPVVVEFQ